MRFIVSVNGQPVVLTSEQLDILSTALTGAERITDIDVGKGNGTRGYADQYIDGIAPYISRDRMQVSVLSEEDYEAIKFVTKQHAESKK